MTIHFQVTQDSFDAQFSIEDWLNFGNLTNIEMYEYMLQFVADDEGKPVPAEAARKLFKGVKKTEWQDCMAQFREAIQKAFINPTNGSG